MELFTNPAHVILLAIVVAIALGIYLVSRRRRNAGPHLDHLDDHYHQHRPGHEQQHGSAHGPADPERHL